MANPKNIVKYREKSGFGVIPSRKLVQYSGFPQLFMLNRYHEMCDFEWINSKWTLSLIVFSSMF